MSPPGFLPTLHCVNASLTILRPPLVCAALLALLGLSGLSVTAASTPLSGTAVGDRLPTDLVAPVDLSVIDPVRTRALHDQELRRLPPFFRFHAAASNEVASAFLQAVTASRTRFQEVMRASGGEQHAVVDAAGLERLLAGFQSGAGELPVTPELAGLWARGDSGDAVLNGWAGRLWTSAGRVIRPDTAAAGDEVTFRDVRLLTVSVPDAAVGLHDAERDCRIVRRAQIVTLSRARNELRAVFPAGERAVGQFLAGLLQANCRFDNELTSLSVARRTADLRALRQYKEGEVIARAGDVVDERIKAVLDGLRDREAVSTETEEAKREAEAAARLLQAEVARMEAEAREARWKMRLAWSAAGVAVVTALVLGVAWRRRSRRRRVLPLAPPARRTQHALATEVFPVGSPSLIQQLFAQREMLTRCQTQAEHEIAQLEERLANAQAPLRERLRAYEERIAELENQLASRSDENRDLIRAAIVTTRSRLEAERARQPQADV